MGSSITRWKQPLAATPCLSETREQELEDAIRYLFYKGGEWPTLRLAMKRPGPKFTHWKTLETKTNPEYLRLGYQGRPVTIASSFQRNPSTRLCG